MQEHITAQEPSQGNSLKNLSYRRFKRAVGPFCGLWGMREARHRRGAKRAVALKLDTRILKGNPLDTQRPAHVPYTDRAAYSGRPINYPLYENSHNYRVKVQEFSSGGCEVLITSINLQRHADMAAMHLLRGVRTERKGDQDSIDKARRRARRMVRLKCKEMGADHLLTFTTRATVSRDFVKAAWAKVTDLISYHLGRKFQYVCVCEPHPSNPTHLHLHAAVRGRLTAREMVIFRRCWYVALGGNGKEKGAAAPGGFQAVGIRVKGGARRRMDKIASYISKYITKETTGEFNKKRYWASKIDLLAARAYWLKARTLAGAMIEFCAEFGLDVPTEKHDYFQARGIDLVWMRYCPDDVDISPVPF